MSDNRTSNLHLAPPTEFERGRFGWPDLFWATGDMPYNQAMAWCEHHRARAAHLEQICAAAYQLAGVVGAPVRFLDALSRFEGDIDSLLPVSIEECDEFKRTADEPPAVPRDLLRDLAYEHPDSNKFDEARKRAHEYMTALSGDALIKRKQGECQALWRTNFTIVCTLPKGYDGDHRADCGYTFNGEVDIKARAPEPPSAPLEYEPLCNALQEALRHARVPQMQSHDGSDYQFVDLMSDPDGDISSGEIRIEYFAESLADALLDILDRPAVTKADAQADPEEETPCPKREDGLHCECWYGGNSCCGCGDGDRTLGGEWPTCAEVRAAHETEERRCVKCRTSKRMCDLKPLGIQQCCDGCSHPESENDEHT